jgi:hypothetical protein
MLTGTKIVLAALAVAGFAQAASATEPLNARIGDQYPFLEQREPVVAQPAGAFAFASAGPSAQDVIVHTQRQWSGRDGVNPNAY